MFRKVDVLTPAVTLLMGKRRSSGQEEIITVMFDRTTFTEDAAKGWWREHQDRLLHSLWVSVTESRAPHPIFETIINLFNLREAAVESQRERAARGDERRGLTRWS
jgi:hypothetical protein